MKFIFSLALLLLPASICQAAACDLLGQSTSIPNLVNLLQKETNSKASWGSFKLTENNIVLMDFSVSDQCLLLFKNGNLEKLGKLAHAARIPNGVYDFISENRVPQGLAEVAGSLEALGVKSALVWNGAFKIPYNVPENFILGMMVHEGFHMFVQRTGNPIWPRWPTVQGQFTFSYTRNDISTKCYNLNSVVKTNAEYELNILIEAVQKLELNDMHGAQLAVNDFIRARDNRYSLLKGIEVRLPNNKTMGCSEAEASFELNEGAAEYAGVSGILKSNVYEAPEIIDYVRKIYSVSIDHESFYAYGALQLLIISKLSKNFDAVVTRLVSSKDPTAGIYSEFIKMANR